MKLNKKVLKSGLTIIHEKRDVPVTTVMIAARFGAAHESIEEKGIAHFIEHMCFKGTKKRNSREIAESIEKVGGDINAFTSEEVTAFHAKLPSEHFELAIDVLFDLFFNPEFPKEDFEKEAGVICEEIKMYNDNPRAYTTDMVKTMLYRKPFGVFIGGTEESVKAITRDGLFKKHREVYAPKNCVLCVVGNNSFAETLKLAKKYCVEREGKSVDVPKIQIQTLKEEEKRENLTQGNVALGFHFPKFCDKDRYAAQIFSAILGEGMSSKLFVEVREKRGLVYNIKSELDMGRNYGYMMVFAGTDGSKVKEVIEICLEEFSKIGEISEKELAEAKVQVIGNRNVENESSSEMALDLITEEICGGAENYFKFEENVKEVTLADLKKLAGNGEFASFILGPK